MEKKVGIALIGLVCGVSVVLVFRHSAIVYSGFWAAFVPSAWANVIGVTVAAVIGIPIGFAINHYFLGLAEQQKRRQQVLKVRNLLQLVGQEVSVHSGSLQALGQLFPPEGGRIGTQPRVQQPRAGQTPLAAIHPATVARLLLQDMFGRQFLEDRSAFEVGESLISFEVANYYVRVGELNRLLELRTQQAQQPDIWDRSIQNVVQSVWIAQQQVGFEIKHAIDRLGKAAIQRQK